TIHNTGYQGNFSKHDLHSTGLPWDAVSKNKAHYIDEINFLRSGIQNSKAVTTVSPSYSEEIKIKGFGHGLEELLVSKKDSFCGILNGVDYSEWDPEQDKLLDLNFSAGKLGNKWKLKEKLQKKAGLETDSGKALIGMVGRLVSQKGFGELCKSNGDNPGAIRQICKNKDVQLVILGTGEKWIEDELKKLDNEIPNLKVYLEFDNTLAHLIEAGSDFFLMPSKYEPCGLNQVYSLKYGSIPIVRATGGLKDTVVDYFEEEKGSTGFHIPEMSSDSIVNTMNSVLKLWRDNKKSIEEIRQRGMAMEFQWEKYAKEYVSLYKKCLNRD
ncbi:MAG: glycogen synthase, partial [Bacteroidetes bacterium]